LCSENVKTTLQEELFWETIRKKWVEFGELQEKISFG
jgi:hypothetical protein